MAISGEGGVMITADERIYLSKIPPPFIVVRVQTDEGLVGLGQAADTRITAVVHDVVWESASVRRC